MPKKKSKMNKLARMSDEERARYLQHRADMEEEARRRKRELIARFIKNKLDKEEAFSRINTAKLNQGWRYILRKLKCKQMALEIQGTMTSFNFMLERKDRLVMTLVRAIEDADDQHRRAFAAHTETLSYFLSIGAQRLDKLQNDFETQKNKFLDIWDKEELDITSNQERSEFKLDLIMFIQNHNFQHYMKERELYTATAKNNEKLEHEEDMRNLCRPKQLEIESYWNKLRQVYNSYMEQHNPIMGHYQMLREKDEFYQREIARNEDKIQQSVEILLHLQHEWIRTSSTMASKLKRMNSHKEELAQKYWQMKKNSKLYKSRAEEKLAVMVDASQDAIKRLESVKCMLDKIIQLADICHKYEHDDDKTLLKDVEDEEGQETLMEQLDRNMIKECKEYSKLDKFLLKVNRVKVQTLCLRAEKTKLSKENVQLKLYIKRYLTDLALKAGKNRPISGPVAHKTNAAVDAPNRPVTCIEGVLSNAVMHEKRMKTEKKNREAESMRSYPRVQCWM